MEIYQEEKPKVWMVGVGILPKLTNRILAEGRPRWSENMGETVGGEEFDQVSRVTRYPGGEDSL